MNRRRLLVAGMAAGAFLVPLITHAAEYQWSVAMPGPVSAETDNFPRAYLWVPPECDAVKAVLVGQHNLLEEPLFEDKRFRKGLTRLCMAEVWVTPHFDVTFDFNAGASERVLLTMAALARLSGYTELAAAPVVPIGHSALASFPWNFAAANPEKTLAVVSLKGDAPRTPLTGSGSPNPDWRGRSIDGVPGLVIIGEYEWVDGRLQAALDFQAQNPRVPLSFYADAGYGHFDLSKPLVDYILLFIEKAAKARLTSKQTDASLITLKPVRPEDGWRADRWHPDRPPDAEPAPFRSYKGRLTQSFWYFDASMARLAEARYAASRGKRPQLLGYIQSGTTVTQDASAAQISLKFLPEADGRTFKLSTTFLTNVPKGSPNPSRWTGEAVGASLGHSSSSTRIERITGPVCRVDQLTWRICFNRVGVENQKRSRDVWFVATNPGDHTYKSAVQQALLRLPPQNTGASQTITFDNLPDRRVDQLSKAISLEARSSAGLKVEFYVKEGPAEVSGTNLRFLAIPRHSRFPLKVTVVAWQYGRLGQIAMAAPVERSFYIIR